VWCGVVCCVCCGVVGVWCGVVCLKIEECDENRELSTLAM